MQDEILQRVQAGIEQSQVTVTIDGNRALIEVESPIFADLSRVQRQQAVYQCIESYIADGTLHAVTIKAAPPAD